MARLVGLAALSMSALGARVAVHTQSFQHLSADDSAKAVRALELLEELKKDASNVDHQNQYRDIIGEVEWEESKVFLQTGAKSNQEPVVLGPMSVEGTRLSLVELLNGRVNDLGFIPTRVARLFTNRRDYAVEEVDGDTKYLIDGVSQSLHSRMHISMPGDEKPRYVLRRAFNWLNPVARTVGQWVYRVVECFDQSTLVGGCREGEILYTITKDRFGRGLLWGHDEYRVYTGTGGCSKHGFGVLSCDQADQIMYSLSDGLLSGSHDTEYYKGNIVRINADGSRGVVYSEDNLFFNDNVNEIALDNMKVAFGTKTAGPPRWLHWPLAAPATGFTINAAVQLAETAAVGVGAATPLLSSGAAVGVSVATGAATAPVLWFLGLAYNLARGLVWADAYELSFSGAGGSVDELLVTAMAAAQDLTRDSAAAHMTGGATHR